MFTMGGRMARGAGYGQFEQKATAAWDRLVMPLRVMCTSTLLPGVQRFLHVSIPLIVTIDSLSLRRALELNQDATLSYC